MATTVGSSFEGLKSRLEITGLQKTTVSTRQQNVREAVEQELNILDSFLTGSYSRRTMIAPLKEADVDIFVVLSSAYYERNSQAQLLDKLRTVLLRTYPNTPKISRNGQAVTITFTDFVVDVVPAYNREGGGFLIPNSITKRWISTDPRVHVDLMNKQNDIHNGDLVPIAKMIKAWNRTINRPFRSLYLELLAVQIFQNVRISDFPSGMRYFFDKGRESIKYKVTDPVEYGEQINGLENVSTVAEAVSRFETAYSRARKAEEYASRGWIANAIVEWKKIFGDYFPTYG